MSIHLYVEGGGDPRSYAACRRAFREFLGKVLGDRPKPRIVASGSRDEAYRDFSRALAKDRENLAILLVDSEGPVAAGAIVAAYLRDRDHWTQPLPDGQVHLMVQCMETWFLADKALLAQYYGDGFRASVLPANPRIEEIPKDDLFDRLARATASTNKGRYHKTRHAFEILERLDPHSVRRMSPFAERLFTVLLRG